MQIRLSAEDWVEAGLAALAHVGHVGLKADVLARRLEISRGSFYWHFANLDAYHRAVALRWQATATDSIIGQLEGVAPKDRLRHLVTLAFKADWRLELAVRAWAAVAGHVRPIVEAVDRRRMAYIEKLLVEGGLDAGPAAMRARIIYWAYLGRVLSRAKIDGPALRGIVAAIDDLAG